MADDDILDAVLDGLADELELERELGVRAVEIDREALEISNNRIIENDRIIESKERPDVMAAGPSVASIADPAGSRSADHSTIRSFDDSIIPQVAFVHDRPLSPKAVAMMAKTIVALGHADGSAPVVVTRPIPKARRYVFLGSRALQAYLPGMRVEENARFRTPKGVDALLVKSPEEIVRFATETPAVRQAKVAMWSALKAFARNTSPETSTSNGRPPGAGRQAEETSP